MDHMFHVSFCSLSGRDGEPPDFARHYRDGFVGKQYLIFKKSTLFSYQNKAEQIHR